MSELPTPRGPLSDACIHALRGPAAWSGDSIDLGAGAAEGDALGEDSQIALYVLYELHYRGFAGVDERWEWQPALLALRAELEADFEAAMRERLPARDDAIDPAALGETIMELIEAADRAQLSRPLE